MTVPQGYDWDDLYPFPARTLPALRYTADNFFLLELHHNGTWVSRSGCPLDASIDGLILTVSSFFLHSLGAWVCGLKQWGVCRAGPNGTWLREQRGHCSRPDYALRKKRESSHC